MPEVDAVMASHRRLFETVDGLDDEVVRSPSLLPDWSRGHVLTHLARNADSHVRMLDGALRGESLEQYAGGWDERCAAIEAGSGRSASELADDVRTACLRLEDAWARMTDEAWDGHGVARGRVWPCRNMPFDRWREVEIHHLDLGLGYDLDEEYVAAELPRMLAVVPSRLPEPDDRRRLLSWLVGRSPQPHDLTLDPWTY